MWGNELIKVHEENLLNRGVCVCVINAPLIKSATVCSKCQRTNM